MGIVIEPIELMALRKLAIICGALAKSLKDPRAAHEQKALTSVLVDVCLRADIDNGYGKAATDIKT